MSASTAFNVAQQIGTNLHKAFQKSEDNNLIESILSDAMQTGDPAVLQDSIGKILSKVSPERQGPAIQYLQAAYKNVQDKSRDKKIKNEMMVFADQIESNNPNSASHKTISDIYRLDIPAKDKSEMVKSIMGVDPFKVEQQNRLRLDSVLKRYTNKLKEMDTEIKNIRYPATKDKEKYNELLEKRKKLVEEKDELLGFEALNIPNSEENLQEQLIEFDSNNKEHQAIAKILFEKLKDKDLVRQELRKKFTGI